MFPVDIWGNVAAWVGAIGTSAAALGAATFYIYDRYRESTSQSRAVNYIQVGAEYIVTNASSQPIYHVRLLFDAPKSLGDALAGASNVYGVKHWQRHEGWLKKYTDQDIYDSFGKLQRLRWHDKWDRIDPGDSVSRSSTLRSDIIISARPYLAFADVRGRHWDLYLDDDKPKRHNKGKISLKTRFAAWRIQKGNKLRARRRAKQIEKNVDTNKDPYA